VPSFGKFSDAGEMRSTWHFYQLAFYGLDYAVFMVRKQYQVNPRAPIVEGLF